MSDMLRDYGTPRFVYVETISSLNKTITDLERQLEEVKKLVDGGLCLPDMYSQPCADEFLADLTKILKEED